MILSFNHSNVRFKNVSHKKNRDCFFHSNYSTTTAVTGGVGTTYTITTTSNSVEVPVVVAEAAVVVGVVVVVVVVVMVVVVVVVETISSMNFLIQQQIGQVNNI
jgi:hypothetical protein